MQPPRVSIIILNWNGWRDTIECLESVYQLDYDNYDVIVVDNGSSDDSIKKINDYATGDIKVESKILNSFPNNKPITVFEISEDKEDWKNFNKNNYDGIPSGRKIIILKNYGNYGYAGGNNIGISFALSILSPDYIFILNNDLVIEENCMKKLLDVFKVKNNAAVAAPVQYSYYLPNSILSAGADVIKYKTKTHPIKNIKNSHDEIKEVPFVSGAALLFKTSIFNEVGYFDECFYLYWEETEFIQRIKNLKYKIYINTKAKVWHKVAKSSKKVNNVTLYLDRRNSILFLKRFGSFIDILLFTISFQILYRSILMLFTSIVKYKNLKRFYAYTVAIYDAFFKDPCDHSRLEKLK